MLALAGAAVPLAALDDPVSELKAAVTALQSKHEAAAIAILKGLDRKLPKLADYVAWFRASAEFGAENYAGVPAALEPVWTQSPASPLTGRAALLGAQAFEQTGNTSGAVSLLRKYYAALPQPQGDLSMAKAFAAAGDAVSAAVYAQRVYYGYPTSSEAAEADTLAANLEAQLGDKYPPAMGNAMLGRALKLLDAGQTEKARKELTALVPRLGGAERDAAQVKIGVAHYNAKDTKAAQRYLNELAVESPQADAERLYYLLLCARRANDREGMNAALDQLARWHPDSTWRLEALLAMGNSYLVENQVDAYEPLYRACYESFPKEARAAGCHWKVTWAHYLRRKDDAADLLREHLRLFPNSDESSASLYFLGRAGRGPSAIRSPRAPITAKSSASTPTTFTPASRASVWPRCRRWRRPLRPRAISFVPSVSPRVHGCAISSPTPLPGCAWNARACWPPAGSTIGPKSSCATPRRMKISRTSWVWNWRPWPAAARRRIRRSAI